MTNYLLNKNVTLLGFFISLNIIRSAPLQHIFNGTDLLSKLTGRSFPRRFKVEFTWCLWKLYWFQKTISQQCRPLKIENFPFSPNHGSAMLSHLTQRIGNSIFTIKAATAKKTRNNPLQNIIVSRGGQGPRQRNQVTPQPRFPK